MNTTVDQLLAVHGIAALTRPSEHCEAMVCFHGGKRYFFNNIGCATFAIARLRWTDYELRPLNKQELREAFPEDYQ